MKPQHQLAHASFNIYQDVEPREFWTSYFAVVPNTPGIKGERFITPSGRMSAGALRVGLWSISSKKTVQSDALTPHLRYLVERLALPRVDLFELLKRTSAQMRFLLLRQCEWKPSARCA
ncbi:hypothetical protein [Paraburkholderia sp. Ac-20342]|uniref:hypothetical protein n=1 Tax=Paraburkholderia sp. Ac-20342 TaxID=2703889 RepID=UPI0032165697